MHKYQILYIISGSLCGPGGSNRLGLALVAVLFFSVWRQGLTLPWLALNFWASCLRPLDTGIIDMSHHVYCHNFCLQVISLCAGWSHWLSSCLSLFALCLSSGCEPLSFTEWAASFFVASLVHPVLWWLRAARVTSPGHLTPQLSLVLSNTVTLFHCLFKTGSNEAAGAGLHRRAWPQSPTLSEGWVIYSSV